MIRIAIFASGSGSNAENLCRFFKNSPICNVSLILSNKKEAYVLTRAEKLGVPHFTFSYKNLIDNTISVDEETTIPFLSFLDEYKIDLIVLAGFLLKIPNYMLDKYNNKIINIHPSLLPSFGGKGMFGENVHKAVIEGGEKESGITIHIVNDIYDNGTILHQSRCPVTPNDTPETLAQKIHELEKIYPKIVEKFVKDRF